MGHIRTALKFVNDAAAQAIEINQDRVKIQPSRLDPGQL